MITLEAGRRATRPLHRHQDVPRELALICTRCDRPFMWPTITRECFNCQRAAEAAFGAPTGWEMSGC